MFSCVCLGEGIMNMQDSENTQEKVEKLLHNIHKVMIGKDETATLCVVALLAEGHILLEDVPGVGKTMLVRTLAKSIDCEFKRIQFTPDLLPSDITGVSMYHPKEMSFEFRKGPIFGNILLADEINRTSPKTQSSLLEAMEERSVTVDGQTLTLKEPFLVMATQNPIEYEGTYPLPEAQLDRFLIKLTMGYPTMEQEVEILKRTSAGHPLDSIEPVMTQSDVVHMQRQIADVYIDRSIQQFIVSLISQTRNDESVSLGVSPRGSISLMRAAKAYAFVMGRSYVIPDDVQFLAPYVLGHRMLLTSKAKYEGVTVEGIIHNIVQTTPVPIRKEKHV